MSQWSPIGLIFLPWIVSGIKFRESFRPFAPAVLREDVNNWFGMDCDSPYMLLVAPVKREKQLPLTEEQKELFGIERLNIPKS